MSNNNNNIIKLSILIGPLVTHSLTMLIYRLSFTAYIQYNSLIFTTIVMPRFSSVFNY